MTPNQTRHSSRSYAIQTQPRKWPVLAKVTWVLLLACMYQPMAAAGSTFPGSPGQKPEDQLGSTEQRDTVAHPPTALSREDIEADIQALEAERTNLLGKYASAHPDVRAVERRLQVRRKQLEMLSQAPNKPK